MTSRNRNFVVVTLPICASILLVGAWFAGAGHLNPPAGPVAPTHKTLTEVEPRTSVRSLPGSASAVYVISQPGSYYLTADVIGVPGKNGIDITVGGVSLDLRGFRIFSAGGSLKGITASGDATISNGALIGWGSAGVDVCQNAILENVRASGCTTGLSVCRGTVSHCVAQQNQTG